MDNKHLKSNTNKKIKRVEITEKDLFMYVWDPQILGKDKFKTIENNYDRFKEELELLISCYKAMFTEIDKSILLRILDKINSYNNSVLAETEDYS